MPGFSTITGDESIMFADNASFNGTQRGGKMTTNAQLWIGATAAPHVKLGTLTSPGGTITIGYSSPNITLDLAGGTTAIDSIDVDASTPPGTDPVVPTVAGLITVTGAQVAAGVVGTNVIRTDSLAANTYTIEIQRSQAVATTTIADNGVSHFNSNQFTVDANGFVSLAGGSQAIDSVQVDAATAPGTNPVLPTAAGLIIVTGGQVAAGTTTNVIRTDSLAANTYTVEVQRSQAVAATTIGDNGVSHFNSAHFTVDANGFVSSLGNGFPWIDQATGIVLALNTGYFVTAATTQTLPASPVQGSVVKIVADTTGAVVVTGNTGQSIRLGNVVSSVAGTMTSTLRGDSLDLVFRAATSTWISIANNGVWVAA